MNDEDNRYRSTTDRKEGSQDGRPEYNQAATGAGAVSGALQEGQASADPGFGYRGEFRVGAITLAMAGNGTLQLRHENTGTITEVAQPVLAQVLSDAAFPPESELGKLAKKSGLERDSDDETAGNGAAIDGSFYVGSLKLSGGGANPLRLTNSNSSELDEEVDELTLEGALEDNFFTRKIDEKGSEKQGEATKGS